MKKHRRVPMNPADIKIDNNIPIPPRSVKGVSVYPIEIMAVGDSFFVPEIKTIGVFALHQRAKKLGLARKFVSRSVTNATGKHLGVRVWRVE